MHGYLLITYIYPNILPWKLAYKFVSPFLVIKAIGPIAFKLDIHTYWRTYDALYTSYLQAAVGYLYQNVIHTSVF